MAINLHIGESANLIISLLGFYLSFRDRKKQSFLLGIRISEYMASRNWWFLIALSFITAFFIKVDVLLLLLLCASLYYISEDKEDKQLKYNVTNAIAAGAINTLKIWPIIFVVGLITAQVLDDFSLQKNVIELKQGNYSDIVYISVMACIFAPLTEEIIFRGMLYKLFKKKIGVFWGCLASSALFSLIHFNILSIVVLFVFSCSLTYVYESQNTIIAPMVSHSLFNILMIILIIL